MQELLPQLQGRGASLWAISTDALADSQDLAQRLKLTFPLGSDPELRVIRQFGVEMTDKSIAVPATFVLRAGDGQIVYRYIGETLFDRPATRAILSAVEQARTQAARQTPDAAAPSQGSLSQPQGVGDDRH